MEKLPSDFIVQRLRRSRGFLRRIADENLTDDFQPVEEVHADFWRKMSLTTERNVGSNFSTAP